jgi:arylsulfatase A-like enzyme
MSRMAARPRGLAVVLSLLAVIGCRGSGAGFRTLRADVPLHLEDHLEAVRVVVPGAPPEGFTAARSRVGIVGKAWGRTTRRAISAPVPGTLEFRVKVPDKARLDFGFALEKEDLAVKLRISAREGAAEPRPLLELAFPEGTPRLQRSVDLSALAGKSVTLALETEAPQPGNVAYWTAPIVSGERKTDKPNIILYVIDGAAAEFMSVYGHSPRTTPNLERLAAEGVVFENAYSNSTRTKTSVPSFMTSLQSSVMGGSRSASDPLPTQAVTMAERLHRAGYVTELLTSNPYCGRASSLDKGVDVTRDTAWGDERPTSVDLHREFCRLRETYPGEPYWVHFQPTDTHQPWDRRASLSGLFASPEDRRVFEEMLAKIPRNKALSYEENIERSGLDLVRFFKVASRLYEGSLAFQDRSIGDLVGTLKARREWDNTLFIVAADHSHVSAGLPYFVSGRPAWKAPLLASHESRIPMIFVWPRKIAPGRRLSQPVSLIDLLPTVLDLAGLPRAEIAQGQSLAPLLLGNGGWKPRPVVFDEFDYDGRYLFGSIEVIDGRWGASLRIDPRPDGRKSAKDLLRPAPLLIFDVRDDPHAFRDIHEARPDLAAKYSGILGRLWKEHLDLAKRFSRSGNVPLNPDQIETLRSLGYLR